MSYVTRKILIEKIGVRKASSVMEFLSKRLNDFIEKNGLTHIKSEIPNE